MTRVVPPSSSGHLGREWPVVSAHSRPKWPLAAFYLIGAVLVASGLVHFGVYLVRGGGWDGPLSWRKPTTFGVSFGLTLITITWVAGHLRLSRRLRTTLLGIFAADCVLEVTGITVQAWRRVPSHFDTETPFDTVVAMSLALGGAVLIAVLGTMAVTAFRGRVEGPPDLRRAVQAGFAFLMLGLATGAGMIAKGEVLIRSGHRQQAYDTAGSLKWVHGVTLHAVLVLPALAVFLAWRGWSPARRERAVRLGIVGYAVATVAAAAVSLAS